MKSGLGNLAARTLDELAAIVRSRLWSIQRWPGFINGFIARPDSPSNPSRVTTDLRLST
jgi:hypothetical protein